MIATASLDSTAILWSVETGKDIHILKESKTEIFIYKEIYL